MYLFAYGTLKSGQVRHDMIKHFDGVLVGRYSTMDKFYLGDLQFNAEQQYPALVATDPPTDIDALEREGWHPAHIVGEVYEMPDDVVPSLDAIEVGYHRKTITVATYNSSNDESTEELNVTAYIMPMGDMVDMIVSGVQAGYVLACDYNDDESHYVEWSRNRATPPMLKSAEIISINGRRDEVDVIPDTILETSVVSAAKDGSDAKTVEEFRTYFTENYTTLKSEARYWLNIFNDALVRHNVEQD